MVTMLSTHKLLFGGLRQLRHQVFLKTGTSRAFDGSTGDVEWISWGSW